jgi:hypothetical protein
MCAGCSTDVMPACYSQDSPQQGKGYSYPGSDHAEDCHCKAHKASLVLVLLSHSIDATVHQHEDSKKL